MYVKEEKIVSTDKYMVIETPTLEKIFVQQNKLLLGPANFGRVDQPIPHWALEIKSLEKKKNLQYSVFFSWKLYIKYIIIHNLMLDY